MCTSKLMGSTDVCACSVLIFFRMLECEGDLKFLESLGLEGGLKEDAHLGKFLS